MAGGRNAWIISSCSGKHAGPPPLGPAAPPVAPGNWPATVTPPRLVRFPSRGADRSAAPGEGGPCTMWPSSAAGIAGLATAARLQAGGLTTLVLEAHGQAGGCAGFFRRRGFAFDAGATTLVDFEPGGVGGEFLAAIGMPQPPGERSPATLPGSRTGC